MFLRCSPETVAEETATKSPVKASPAKKVAEEEKKEETNGHTENGDGDHKQNGHAAGWCRLYFLFMECFALRRPVRFFFSFVLASLSQEIFF